jgi:hypothetical protein
MTNNCLSKTAVNYGAMSGLASFIVFLALYFKGVNPLGNASWLGVWIPIVFIILSTKFYRTQCLEGFITYGQAMKIGLWTSFAAALLFSLLVYIFVTIIDGNVLELYKNEIRSGLEEIKYMLSKQLYEQLMENNEKETIAMIAYKDFFMKMVGGLIVSFITSAMYRKLPDEIQE